VTQVTVAGSSSAPPPRWLRGRTLSDGTVLHWWKQVLAVLAVYVLYELIRNKTISGPEVAFDNALRIIDWQRALGINHELVIQQWSLEWMPLIVFSNYFYGSVYVGATFGIIVWLYRNRSDAYPLWRNTLAFMTSMGLIGFAFFPLMPPRLLDAIGDGRPFGFVDTLVDFPTFWSFDSEAMRSVSNPFAAMPSLHCAWAFWGAFAVYPRVRSNWARALAVAYPIITVYVVVSTGNHFFLDAVGAALIFVAGYAIARVVTRAGRGRPLSERDDEAPRLLDTREDAPRVGQPYRSIAAR